MIKPANSGERTRNPLRPQTFAEIIGQHDAKYLMQRAVTKAKRERRNLEHVLLVGPGGTGKSTFSHVLANELGKRCFDVEAPVSRDTLMELREVMQDGDILRIEEIHQQGIMQRRGLGTAAGPEQLYDVMEDGVITTEDGPLPFPSITVVGTTTDEGMLPDSFVMRFPLRPQLVKYAEEDLVTIALWNGKTLGVTLHRDAAVGIARACRGVPREINNLVRQCSIIASSSTITAAVVTETLANAHIEPDGLTPDMVGMLTFLYEKCKRWDSKGEIRYESSIGRIATYIGKSRDSKAVNLRVEPYLINRGLIDVTNSGRKLTEAGIERAKQLVQPSQSVRVRRPTGQITNRMIDRIREAAA